MIRKIAHNANGAAVIGLLLVAWVSRPLPAGIEVRSAKVPDFLSAALWEGCKAQGIRRLRARVVGSGWR
jgi:hypothetical protein